MPSRLPATMQVRYLSSSSAESPASQGEGATRHHAHAYVIDGTLAIDAGSLAFHGSPEDQAKIRDVLITHSHADHVASLPMFLENAAEIGRPPTRVRGSAAVLESLRKDVFNDRVWPSLERLSAGRTPPFELIEIEPDRPFDLEGLRIRPVELDHVVPTMGFLVEGDRSAALFVSDTGPTERIWTVASGAKDLAAVFLESSFPDAMQDLARTTCHLTPSLFAAETAKLDRGVAWIAVHIKPRWHERTVRELLSLGIEGLSIARSAKEYAL